MTQERSLRTRERILDAAAGEFAARGFAQTRLDDVVARTGMSKGALYGHFASKDALARAVLADAEGAWLELVAQAESPHLTPVEALRLLTVGLARQLQNDPRVRAGLRLATELQPSAGGRPAALGPIPRLMVEFAGRAQTDPDFGPRAAIVAQLMLTTVLGSQALPALRLDPRMQATIEDLWAVLAQALPIADSTSRA